MLVALELKRDRAFIVGPLGHVEEVIVDTLEVFETDFGLRLDQLARLVGLSEKELEEVLNHLIEQSIVDLMVLRDVPKAKPCPHFILHHPVL